MKGFQSKKNKEIKINFTDKYVRDSWKLKQDVGNSIQIIFETRNNNIESKHWYMIEFEDSQKMFIFNFFVERVINYKNEPNKIKSKNGNDDKMTKKKKKKRGMKNVHSIFG